MVRARQRESFQLEVRIMVIGEFESGKSTLVGTQVTGKKDNGKGSIRMKVQQYQHERKSGRTSSLNYNVIGFDSAGNVKNHSLGQLGTSWEGIIEDSNKILAFLESGAYEKNKYSKAWIHNVLNSNPDYCLLVINGMKGVTEKTTEQFRIAKNLKTPCFIVITHIDRMTKDSLDLIQFDIRQMVVGMFIEENTDPMYPLRVNNKEEIIDCVFQMKENLGCIPVFSISCTEWYNIDQLLQFLNLLPVTNENHGEKERNAEFLINRKIKETDNSMVVLGTVLNGTIRKNLPVFFGPFHNGSFSQTQIKNIRCYLLDVRKALCGQSCSIEIKLTDLLKKKIQSNVRSSTMGMVLVESPSSKVPVGIMEFTAEFKLCSDKDTEKTMPPNYQPVVNSNTFRQCCKVVTDNNDKIAPSIMGKLYNESIEGRTHENSYSGYPTFSNKKVKFKMSMNESDAMSFKNNYFDENDPLGSNELQDLTLTKKMRSKSGDHNMLTNKPKKSKTLKSTRKLLAINEIPGEQLVNDRILKHEDFILPVLSGNKKTTQRMRFMYFPEYVIVGQKVMIADQRLHAVGTVKSVVPMKKL